jgi:hypothetical protein
VVTIARISGSGKAELLVPKAGTIEGAEAVRQLIKDASIRVTWHSGCIKVTPNKGTRHWQYKLPLMELPDLIARLEHIVTVWFGAGDSLVIFDPHGVAFA